MPKGDGPRKEGLTFSNFEISIHTPSVANRLNQNIVTSSNFLRLLRSVDFSDYSIQREAESAAATKDAIVAAPPVKKK